MLDLVSTRGVDPHTRGCAQLLAAVIADAIKSACHPPSEREKKLKRNFNTTEADADASIRFLFDPDSIFPTYAGFIGLDADALRAALLGRREAGPNSEELFSAEDRRVISHRLRWHRSPA